VYVDDIALAGNSPLEIQTIKLFLDQKIKIKVFLGTEIKISPQGIFVIARFWFSSYKNSQHIL